MYSSDTPACKTKLLYYIFCTIINNITGFFMSHCDNGVIAGQCKIKAFFNYYKLQKLDI